MIAGVDGCKAGWLVAVGEGWPCTKPPELLVCLTFKEVLDSTAACKAVVVDMPMGLPSGKAPRACDLEAQAKLGPEGRNRVFLAPPREALQAKCPADFQTTCRQLTGRGAGLPVWGIVPKLREVEESMSPELQQRVREFHPELTWARLAGQTLPSKHQTDGLFQRLEILERHGLGLAGLGRQPALRNAAPDDVLDAIVGLAVAHGIAAEPAYDRRLPSGEPPRDERGLRMEIWF